MGWADKVHKKHKREKLTEELIAQMINHPQYLEIKENIRNQACLDAFCAFCFVGCEYLEKKHRYGKNGMLNFLEFVAEKLCLMDNKEFFVNQVNYYEEKYGFDIRDVLCIEYDQCEEDQVRW